MCRRSATWMCWFLATLCVLFPGRAAAHEQGLSRGDYAVVGARLTATLVFARRDVTPDAPREELAATFARGLVVRADGAPCPTALVSARPLEADATELVVLATCPHAPRTLGVEVAFLGALPFGHRHLAHTSARDVTLMVGQRELSWEPATRSRASASLFVLGLQHILTGADHLVFLLALALVGGEARRLFWVVTAFTVGHSLSLALATFGLWVPGARLVEPLIALSIVYVGVENLTRPSPEGRWRVTLPFGFVHGFGFATALRELGMPRAELPAALVLFNVGVEVGQLAALLVMWPALRWLHRQSWFGDRGVRRASAAIVVAGGAWFLARLLP